MGLGALTSTLLTSEPGLCSSGLAGRELDLSGSKEPASPVSHSLGARVCLVLLVGGSYIFDLSWTSCCKDPNNLSQSGANRKQAHSAETTAKELQAFLLVTAPPGEALPERNNTRNSLLDTPLPLQGGEPQLAPRLRSPHSAPASQTPGMTASKGHVDGTI